MPKRTYIQLGFVLLAGALVLAGAVIAMRPKGLFTPGASQSFLSHTGISHAGTSAAGASSAGENQPVIRFVNNPEMAPAFDGKDIYGKTVSAADLKGKVVLLNFWATWCPPCRMEVPEMITLQQTFGDQLAIIGVSEDEDAPAKVFAFAEKQAINYPIIMATPKLVAAYGGVPALPTTFVIDTQGRVVQKHSGLYPPQVYTREIRALLKLPVDARIETFEDTGQVFLKNVAKATELPGVDFSGLTPEQKQLALHRMNAESCTCGCDMTIAQCRVNDSACPTSAEMAAKIVKEVKQGTKSRQASLLQPTNFN